MSFVLPVRSWRADARVLVALSALATALPSAAQSLERFSPQGEVKRVRQATAAFSTPMVALGDPRAAGPFDVECAVPGNGRWVDPKRWVYDFASDLPAGLRCSFALKPGTKDLAGAALPPARHALSTGGPSIVRSLPWDGARIDESQVFILGLDAPAKPESVAKHARCVAAGVNEEIGVRLVTGEERRTILDSRRSFASSWLRAVLVDGESGRARHFLFRLPASGSDAERFARLRDAPDSPIVTLACARALPAGAEAKLVWGRGIEATTGVATSAAQTLAFRVRPAFRASFSCERVNKDAQCLPVLPMTLSFTAPVAKGDAARIRLVDAAGKAWPATLPRAEAGTVDRVSFGPGLPERQRFRIELPDGLRDDAGRALVNARSFPLAVRTDESPPLAKFAADFGILERVLPDKSRPMLPVTLRNVEAALAGGTASVRPPKAAAKAGAPVPGQVMRVAPGDDRQIVAWFRRLAHANRIEREYDSKDDRWMVKRNGYAESIFNTADTVTRIAVPKPGGGKAFEVVGIPLAAPGFYVVELASPKLGAALIGEAKPWHARAAALVTNLSVHVKLGRESSLVWVTRLSDASVVEGAAVAVRDCNGRTHWEGRTDASGIARIAARLPAREELPSCGFGDAVKEYFVSARTADDRAFAMPHWGEGIAPWRFNVPTGRFDGPFVAHAVLDRSLVRTGESVSMKVFVRETTGGGFALVPRKALGDKLTIRHLGSDREYEVPVRWAAGASPSAGEAVFEVPKDAYTGSYQVFVRDTLAGRKDESDERPAATFRVEAFRVPLLRARLKALGAPLVVPESVDFDVQVQYLAGGAAGGLPVRLRTQTERRPVVFDDWDGYAFAAGDVKEGRETWGDGAIRDGDFRYADPDDEPDAGEGPRAVRGAEQAFALDAAGGARATVKDVGKSADPRDLVAELEYRDPNGQTLTAATRVALWPSKLVLGIKPDGWASSKERLKFSVVALDVAGRPLPGVRVQTDAYRREAYSHRRRLVGGFYAYEHGYDTTRVGPLCEGVTDAKGRLACEAAAPASGQIIVRARAADADGRPALTRADVWVSSGDDDEGFAATDNDRFDLIAEEKRYEPGATARFQARIPFREATALVTVEREGVLDATVLRIARGEPVVEVSVKGNYAPNVFVSALVVRGRVADPRATAMVDLARPSFRMGLAEIRVGWAAHELAVKVVPDGLVHKTRDRVPVAIQVRRPDGTPPPKGAEVAIAAVDEGLLELMPNATWKLLDAMMVRRGEEVDTSTAQMQVIGKRHFGRKAVAPGGGGGRMGSRELFDTLLLWRARVPLDDEGRASIVVPLNDSLTGFRIVAVASAGAGLFGTGEASVRATQDLMLLSGLPQRVRDGDRFAATFTVRNASERPIDVSVAPRAAAGAAVLPGLDARTLALAPGEARELAWTAQVPTAATSLAWQVDASARAGADGAVVARDSIKLSQGVTPLVPERTWQATILRLDAPRSVPVERPADAIPGRGGVNVQMQASLAGDLPGVREWLERYPYTCLEQRVSVAIGLSDRRRWDAVVASLADHLDRDGFARYWTLLRDGDDVLTSYVLSIAHEAGFEIPERERRRMEQALVAFVEGRAVRGSALPTADLAIRKVAALEALSRRSEPFDPRWLDTFAIEPNLWPTSAVVDWTMVLARQPKLPRRDERLGAAQEILRARLNFQGTTMGFSTEKSDALWWLMISADANANKLILATLGLPGWKDDLPRLVRGSLGRMQRGHWNTTVANAWGTVALDRFAAKFESTAPAGTTSAALAGRTFEHAWKPDDGAKTYARRLPWPDARADVTLRHDGTGVPWVTLTSVAAIPVTAPFSSGYRISRSVAPVRQQTPGTWRRGDVARVTLDLDAQSDMAWVVVDDPLPAGATALGRGLGGESALDAQGERRAGAVWPAFEERTATAFRAYFRYVPKGRFVVEYTVRLDNPGDFGLPATRVEAMYAPEMFGERPNDPWRVAP
ncbi:MAG: alpha-2-macroglobulin [Burkholderiales bacterium]|nr:alpha-2-macroglobulin [Burkholderiales bacterium]